MDPPRCTFLEVPREIRNRIYHHLFRQLDFDWDRSDGVTLRGALGDEQIFEPVPVRLRRCPLPHVFRIHPRIREEYYEECVENLEAVIDPTLHTLEWPLFDAHPKSNAISDAVISRVRHVTIFLKLHARTTSMNLDWQNQLNLLRAVATKAPQLKTLRVAIRQQYYLDSPTFNDGEVPSVLVPTAKRLQDADSTPFLPRVPTNLDTMSLVQRGEGYHIGYALTYKHIRVAKPVVPTFTIAEHAYSISHGIRKIGVYLFAQDDANYTKRMWTEKEVIAKYPLRRYPAQVLANVAPERAELLARLPYQLTEYVERKGVEEVSRWA
ncbi:hypothetical protein IQ06DRAFT_281563 [Phaeosphaeriaceae sp. SRC1lsM3a]|nr:hypothetical protein IQ06DRAFT_281563 [Stagonospora sp. SRC1lsM3a]